MRWKRSERRAIRGVGIRAGTLAAAFVAAALACGSSTGVTGPPPGEGPAILFVGNSLTYFNDMPEIVAAISLGADDDPPMRVGMVAFGGFSLEDHWNRGDALDAIDSGEWDVVVLQQGPSTLPESRDHLVEWAGRFAERIRAAGAEPALYSVWPMDGSESGYDATLASYAAAAEAVDGMLIPAGEAWRAARASDPELDFTVVDGFHPSLLGSVIVGYAVWHAVGGRSPVGLPPEIESPRVEKITMPPALAALVQQAVVEAQAAHGRP
ncbi:MAG TPA: hypothetical protein VFH82_01555 [Gemmatimonadota bacterium]|jgi:hypothetical protein|nr:hypothetical protein [Gemmatimonadota bacterium]